MAGIGVKISLPKGSAYGTDSSFLVPVEWTNSYKTTPRYNFNLSGAIFGVKKSYICLTQSYSAVIQSITSQYEMLIF